MHVEMLTVGMFQSNCFIVSCEETKEAIIVDAGEEGDRILARTEALGLAVKMIVNTHAHIDHVAGLPAVHARLGVPVLMHRDEMMMYARLSDQAMMFGLETPDVVEIDRFIVEGDEVAFGKLAGRVVDTPGHSPGGISLVFDTPDPPRIFVGDVLFQGSIGRTDLLGSDHARMLATLKNVIMPLPDDMIVYPGHGPETTIGFEKKTNPFLLGM